MKVFCTFENPVSGCYMEVAVVERTGHVGSTLGTLQPLHRDHEGSTLGTLQLLHRDHSGSAVMTVDSRSHIWFQDSLVTHVRKVCIQMVSGFSPGTWVPQL